MSDMRPPAASVADDPLPDLLRGLRSQTTADRLRAARGLARLGWLAREALPAYSFTPSKTTTPRSARSPLKPSATWDRTAPHTRGHVDASRQVRSPQCGLGHRQAGPLARPALTDLCAGLKNSDPRTASGAAQASVISARMPPMPSLLSPRPCAARTSSCRRGQGAGQIGSPALSTLIGTFSTAIPSSGANRRWQSAGWGRRPGPRCRS